MKMKQIRFYLYLFLGITALKPKFSLFCIIYHLKIIKTVLKNDILKVIVREAKKKKKKKKKIAISVRPSSF